MEREGLDMPALLFLWISQSAADKSQWKKLAIRNIIKQNKNILTGLSFSGNITIC
jgi:hypothetical protein